MDFGLKSLMLTAARMVVLGGFVFMISLPVSASGGRAPGVIYQVFPRSFQDSDGDGVGDLNGLTSRLDYIADLGVDAVWVTPIMPSPSYHGYDVTDYLGIQPDFGDTAAFQKFVQRAHDLRLRVIMDIPLNHTSNQHPWFRDASRANSPLSNMYVWSAAPLDWKNAPVSNGQKPQDLWHRLGFNYYFASFDTTFPDLNWRNTEVFNQVSSMLIEWTRRGVDGFRLDAAKLLVEGPSGESDTPETHDVWRRLVASVRQAAPQTYFVGEVWDSEQTLSKYYGKGDELDAAFDFPFCYAVREALRTFDAGPLVSALRERLMRQPSNDFAAPFVGNHDLDRLANEFTDTARLKLAALTLLTMPGTPTIYYGDEIGLPNGRAASQQGDLGKRTPMQWDGSTNLGFTSARFPWTPAAQINPLLTVESQKADQESLLNTYRALIHLRAKTPALWSGEFTQIQEPAKGVVMFYRKNLEAGGPDALVILNYSSTSQTFVVDKPDLFSEKRVSKTIFGGSGHVTDLGQGPRSQLRVEGLGPVSGFVVLLDK